MTIKEAEARTGLTRANIRYYEGEGFFSAARGENGYRNYSEEDIEILLKLKLLRQLGFSLEEVHALQNGDESLERALERREAGLSEERRAIDQFARLCHEIRTDGAEFCSLDALRYLERLGQKEEALERDQDPIHIFPWRRYFARVLDNMLYTALLVVVLQLTVRLNGLRIAGELGGEFLLKAGGLLLMAVGETLLLHFTGTTPGKALLGLKILREDGSCLDLLQAAQRTYLVVLFYGGAILLSVFDLPLFSLIGLAMLVWACWQVYHGKSLFWEGEGELYLDGSTRETPFWSRKRSFLRVAGWLAACAGCIGLMVGGHFLAAAPLHRGPVLTVEEFVDNYNQLMSFTYGEENLDQRLRTDGTFEDIPREDNVFVFDLTDRGPVPDVRFLFTQEEGVLTGVTLSRSYTGGTPIRTGESYFVSVPYTQALAAARSFLWSQLGYRGTSALYEELIEKNGTLCWERNGMQINSVMQFSGYSAFSNELLLADEGEIQSYFVNFAMELTEK